MGEAVYLRKPMLAVPLGRQFEQLLNARYLEAEGFGAYAETLADPAVVQSFVDRLPRFEEKLAGYEQDGNKLLFEGVDQQLDQAAAGLL
jgi:UDP-N-acetylglucosamine:LPS N-acetylglucosamine transferase